jgi:hypothetical protein
MAGPHIFTEERPAESASARAVVINYSLAWTIFVTAIGALVAGVVWVTTIDNRVTAIEGRRATRDAQFEGIADRIDQLETRIRPLEVTSASTAASLAFIRDQLTDGFVDISKRLDRIEDGKPRP